MYQIQGQMAVCDVGWVVFVVWTKKGMSVQRIEQNKKMWRTMLPKLKYFLFKGLRPMLFTKGIQSTEKSNLIFYIEYCNIHLCCYII